MQNGVPISSAHVLLLFSAIILGQGYVRMIRYSFRLRGTANFVENVILPQPY